MLANGKFLLQLRDSNCSKFPGKWCFPGGACDGNESFDEALVREAKEECNVDLVPERCTLLMRRLGNQNRVYLCPYDKPETMKLGEGAAMEWMTLQQIEQIKLGFNQSDILTALRKFLVER